MTRGQLVAVVLILAAGAWLASRIANLAPSASSPTPAAHAQHEGEEVHEEGAAISDAALALAGVELATAGAGVVRVTLPLNGQVVPNQERVAHVSPRFPGMIQEARKRLGERVEKGETLAVIQSNDSLAGFALVAPVAGTVIARDALAGEYAAQGQVLYRIADLSSVWIELVVPRGDLEQVAPGRRVALDGGAGIAPREAEIAWVSPLALPETQSALARVEIDNPDGRWRPGLFVVATVVLDEVAAAVAVPLAAIQRMDGGAVVFVRSGERFAPRPVTLGRADGTRVEVLSGLRPGETYAAANSFVVKAELGKATASHDH